MPEFPVDVMEMAERVSDPGATANTGKAYTKDVAGVTQLFYQASDGAVAQATPVVPSSGTINFSDRTVMFAIGPGSTTAGGTTNIFASGSDEATLAVNSTYRFSAHILLINAGTSQANLSFGGTATYSTFEYVFASYGNTTASEHGFVDTTSAVLMNGTAYSSPYILTFEGTLRTSGAGTIIPQISGTSGMVVSAGSWMEIVYLGSDTYVSQGGWG